MICFLPAGRQRHCQAGAGQPRRRTGGGGDCLGFRSGNSLPAPGRRGQRPGHGPPGTGSRGHNREPGLRGLRGPDPGRGELHLQGDDPVRSRAPVRERVAGACPDPPCVSPQGQGGRGGDAGPGGGQPGISGPDLLHRQGHGGHTQAVQREPVHHHPGHGRGPLLGPGPAGCGAHSVHQQPGI